MLHTGQIFVPDAINMQIDKMWPYNTNPIADKWGRTRNWADSLNIYQDAHGNGANPEFEILKVGSVIQQGLIGYITVGVDSNASYDINAPWKPVRLASCVTPFLAAILTPFNAQVPDSVAAKMKAQ